MEKNDPFFESIREWRAFQSGSARVFRKIDETFRKPIEAYFLSRLKDHASAQDLVQEVFLKIFRFRESHRWGVPFAPWVWSISKNSGLDEYRRQSKIPSIESWDDEVWEQESPEVSPEVRLLLLERLKGTFLRAIQTLTFEQRRVLLLRLARNWSLERIARETGSTVGAVKALLHRSHRKLALSAPTESGGR